MVVRYCLTIALCINLLIIFLRLDKKNFLLITVRQNNS